MDYIKVTSENIDREHICCAIANDNDIQVSSKKAWLKERFSDGLVFLKGNVRGKCFIEYIPAEKAWIPMEAREYLYIDCLWIAGKYKGQGYSNRLLQACMDDARNMGRQGLVILSSEKKRPYLSDPRFLKYKGFLVADTCEPYFKLMYLPLSSGADIPRFRPHLKENQKIRENGLVVYYTNQCPFTAKYVPVLEEAAKRKGVEFHSVCIASTQEAQDAPTPFTTFSLFYNGKWVTHEILSEKRVEQLIGNIT